MLWNAVNEFITREWEVKTNWRWSWKQNKKKKLKWDLELFVCQCGLVESACTWDGTGCEFDSCQCRKNIISHVHGAYDYSGLWGSLGTYGLIEKLCLKNKHKCGVWPNQRKKTKELLPFGLESVWLLKVSSHMSSSSSLKMEIINLAIYLQQQAIEICNWWDILWTWIHRYCSY